MLDGCVGSAIGIGVERSVLGIGVERSVLWIGDWGLWGGGHEAVEALNLEIGMASGRGVWSVWLSTRGAA